MILRALAGLDIETTCEGFTTGSGLLTFTPVGAPASLVGDQTFAEDVLSALLLDVIPTFVNDQIRDSLKDFAVDSTPTVSSFACRSLGVSTKAQGFPIESVNFDRPTFRLPGGTSIQEVVVRVTKIHRLQVRAADGIPDGTQVYHVVEVPHLDFYAGYSHIVVPVKGMKEGDTVNLTTGNSVSTPLPPSTGLLVLIANLSSRNDDVNADYAFTTFGSATNFGNGVHTLAVPKHWTQPNAQPSLQQVTLSAPGYQLTLEITRAAQPDNNCRRGALTEGAAIAPRFFGGKAGGGVVPGATKSSWDSLSFRERYSDAFK